MKQCLFSSKTILALIAACAFAAVPAASASAATAGHYVTLPVGSHVAPVEQLVWEATDLTVVSDVTVGNVQAVRLHVDPKVAW